jgi:hypothetical protein
MPKKHFDLMPPNGKAPSMLHLEGEIEEPQIPVKAFVFPAENMLSILKSLDGVTLIPPEVWATRGRPRGRLPPWPTDSRTRS